METIKFKQVANEWLNLKKNELRQISYEKYRQVYDAHLVFFNNMEISNIRENDIKEFMAKKKKKKNYPKVYFIVFNLY